MLKQFKAAIHLKRLRLITWSQIEKIEVAENAI
jgi:hypothetical protein